MLNIEAGMRLIMSPFKLHREDAKISLNAFRCAIQMLRYEPSLGKSPSSSGDNSDSRHISSQSASEQEDAATYSQQQALMDHISNVVDVIWRLVSLLMHCC